MTSWALSAVISHERTARLSRPAALGGVLDFHADDAEHALVEPCAPAQAGDVAALIRVVADQHGLWPVEYHLPADPNHQVRSLVPAEHVREHLQDRASLVVAVGGAPHDFGMDAERRVVDERAVPNQAQVIGHGQHRVRPAPPAQELQVLIQRSRAAPPAPRPCSATGTGG